MSFFFIGLWHFWCPNGKPPKKKNIHVKCRKFGGETGQGKWGVFCVFVFFTGPGEIVVESCILIIRNLRSESKSANTHILIKRSRKITAHFYNMHVSTPHGYLFCKKGLQQDSDARGVLNSVLQHRQPTILHQTENVIKQTVFQVEGAKPKKQSKPCPAPEKSECCWSNVCAQSRFRRGKCYQNRSYKANLILDELKELNRFDALPRDPIKRDRDREENKPIPEQCASCLSICVFTFDLGNEFI